MATEESNNEVEESTPTYDELLLAFEKWDEEDFKERQ